jgi:hypothetical protein
MLVVAGIAALGTAVYVATWQPPIPLSSTLSVRPSATLLIAIRDVARLETNELHLEKVIDLSDKQSQFFGLIEATDAILLVATGDVVVGVDLSKIDEGDVSIDPKTKVASLTLPPPQIFSSHLDESKTYVYTRSTSMTARRSDHLETKARQEAVAAIEKAARESDVMIRARGQAEKELRSLAMGLGASSVVVTWK